MPRGVGGGGTWTEEHRRKISAAHMGKRLSEETKQKLSVANLGEKSHKYKSGQWIAYPRYLYGCWSNIIQRCTNPRNFQYKNYGARGIGVCSEWRDSKTFMDYVLNQLGERPDASYSIDRIDNNGNYESGNIRWANKSVQRLNQRRAAR